MLQNFLENSQKWVFSPWLRLYTTHSLYTHARSIENEVHSLYTEVHSIENGARSL